MSRLKKYIGDKAFYKMAFAIIIPVVIQQMILSLAGFIDNLMINGFSQTAYAGVSTANRFMFIINFFWIGITAGISVFVAQYFGAKNRKSIMGTIQLGLLIAVLIGVLSSLIIYFLGPIVIRLFLPLNDPLQVEAVGFGIDYVRVIALGAVVFLSSFMISTIFRSMGRATVPLIAGIVGIVVNMSLNLVLIYGYLGFPAMGALGAAWATVISKFVELVILIMFAFFFSVDNYAKDLFKRFCITKRIFVMYLKKGTPIVLNEVLWSIAMVLYARFITSGVFEWVTAYGYSQTATDIFFVYYAGMATATGVLIGQALGEGAFDKAKDHLRKLRGIMMITNIGVMVFIVGFSPLLLLALTPVNHLYWLAYQIILINVGFILIYGYNSMSYYTLRAGGDALRSFLLDQLPTYFVGLPLVVILSLNRVEWGVGILIIFLASKSTDIVKLYFSMKVIRKETWLNNLAEPETEQIQTA